VKKKIVDNTPTEDTTPTIINSIKVLSLMIRTGESLGTYPPVGDSVILYCIVVHTGVPCQRNLLLDTYSNLLVCNGSNTNTCSATPPKIHHNVTMRKMLLCPRILDFIWQ